jgi:DNA-binding MarR family transcriptional regulator
VSGARARNESLAVSTWARIVETHGLMLREIRRSVPPRLTVPQVDVLARLAGRNEGMTPGELTRALLVTGGNVTGIVERLRRLGLVVRRPEPRDRRAVRVSLTPGGRRVARRAVSRVGREVSRLLARVPARELVRLRDLLDLLNTQLRDAQPPRRRRSR